MVGKIYACPEEGGGGISSGREQQLEAQEQDADPLLSPEEAAQADQLDNLNYAALLACARTNSGKGSLLNIACALLVIWMQIFTLLNLAW